MSRLSGLLALLFMLAAPAGVFAQVAGIKNQADRLMTCVGEKAGPEGDLPSAGPLRERILKDMEGGPQACIGLVEKECIASGGDGPRCMGQEARAWLQALNDGMTHLPEKNRAIWRKTASGVRAQAIALCEAAAAGSAWGSETVGRKGKYGFTLDSGCVRDGIAQQAIILLVNVRGN